MLASYEGVIAADTGHIAVHEAGQLNLQAIRCWPYRIRMANLSQVKLRTIFPISTQMLIMLTWFIQEWFIFPTRLNMVQFIAKQS